LVVLFHSEGVTKSYSQEPLHGSHKGNCHPAVSIMLDPQTLLQQRFFSLPAFVGRAFHLSLHRLFAIESPDSPHHKA
jgi:hypothetical protein